MARKRFRTKSLIVLLLCTICLATVFFYKQNRKLNEGPRSDRERILVHVNNLIKNKNGMFATEGQACRVPTLDLNATEIISLLKEVPKVVCNKTLKDWVEVIGSTARITDWAKKKFGEIECSFTDIIRENDNRQYQGMTTSSHTEYNLETSDVITVYCKAKPDIIWQKVFMGIRLDQEILDRTSWSKVPEDALKLNFLMFGFDSLSHNMWKRKLPKTYKYATEDLKGIALNGYNIVGDGTPQALIPMLTGKTELELPDTRKRIRKSQHVNVYPFIWNDFSKNGYVTAWGEDMYRIGTFTFRLKGFNKQPVDHYMRTYFAEVTESYSNEKQFCYGELKRFQIMLNVIRNLYEVYNDRPKFTFLFHAEYSHEGNEYVAAADDDTLEWLQEFQKKGYLNNTFLVLMSDHGSRFDNVRSTLQGKQEERLPAFIFILPPWFSKKYPEAYENLKKNVDRLTTPFDIHETLKNILHFEGAGMGNTENRGISLFKEVPLSRTCRDARIEPHWCTCLNWETIPVDNTGAVEAVDHLLKFINSYTSEHRDLCAELTLDKILWSAKLLPNEYIRRYKRNYDYDGFVGDLSDNTKIIKEIYQVKVSFSPGNMIYEASIQYHNTENKYVVSEREISRVNKYKHMTHCIEDSDILHHLRKYCNCL